LVSAEPPARSARRFAAAGIRCTSIGADTAWPNPADAQVTIERLRAGQPGPRWAILDSYHFTDDYVTSLQAIGCRTLWLDDLNEAVRHSADLLVNPTLGAERCA